MHSQNILAEKGFSETGFDFGNIDIDTLNEKTLQSLVTFLESYEDGKADFFDKVVAFGNDNIVDSAECHREYGAIGITCLKLFIQANWTGPHVEVESLGPLIEIVSSEKLSNKCIDILESNGDEMYQLVRYPPLLCIAYMILVLLSKKLNLVLELPLWSMKCFSVFCHIVEEISEHHLKCFQNILGQVDKDGNVLREFPKNFIAEFYMCCYHLHLKFYNCTKAKECLELVKDLLQIDVSLTASLGKRTKFQLKDLPQMKLEVKLGKDRDQVQNNYKETEDLPTDVILDNDTLLPHIEFVDGNNMNNTDLSPLDQAIIICNCIHIQKTSPKDKLSYEELLPFLDTVLHAPKLWAIQHKALFLRSVTEMNHSRKMERAMSQLESLVKTFDKKTPEAHGRYCYAQAVDLQPQWMTEKEHAQLRFINGYVDTALEIFLRLQLWDEVISCYQRLGKHGKAEEVIREQLNVRESAKLWCLLGDVTMDKQYYEKAWEFSKHRSSRSQRSLGQWHLRRKEYEEAIPYFKKSLEINCLQPGIAFSLGCSCMFINEIQGAAKALQACVSLDPDNHQAWNNLASTFLRLGQVQKGYKALQESARLSYDNWRIWENFLLVATDIGAFEDSISCCHRLVDLRRKQIDAEVLHILVKATVDEELDHQGISAARLKPRLFKLFGHITSQITNDPDVWEIYAKLCLSNNDSSSDEKALQNLYRSHRCYTQHTDWEKDESQLKNVMRVTKQMMEVTRTVCGHAEFKGRSLSLYSTTRMAISNLVIRLNKAFVDSDGKLPSQIQPHVAELESNAKEIQRLIHLCS